MLSPPSWLCPAINRFFRIFWDQPYRPHFDSASDSFCCAVVIYHPGWNAPYGTCFFQCHVVHTTCTSNKSYYTSFSRRIPDYRGDSLTVFTFPPTIITVLLISFLFQPQIKGYVIRIQKIYSFPETDFLPCHAFEKEPNSLGLLFLSSKTTLSIIKATIIASMSRYAQCGGSPVWHW